MAKHKKKSGSRSRKRGKLTGKAKAKFLARMRRGRNKARGVTHHKTTKRSAGRTSHRSSHRPKRRGKRRGGKRRNSSRVPYRRRRIRVRGYSRRNPGLPNVVETGLLAGLGTLTGIAAKVGPMVIAPGNRTVAAIVEGAVALGGLVLGHWHPRAGQAIAQAGVESLVEEPAVAKTAELVAGARGVTGGTIKSLRSIERDMKALQGMGSTHAIGAIQTSTMGALGLVRAGGGDGVGEQRRRPALPGRGR